jgi:hypothetical protein
MRAAVILELLKSPVLFLRNGVSINLISPFLDEQDLVIESI